METSGDDRVTISYEVRIVPVDTGDKPRAIKVRKDLKLSAAVDAHLRIKTPFDDPFVLVSVMSPDPRATATVKDILKSTVEVVVRSDMKCNATLFALIYESNPENIW